MEPLEGSTLPRDTRYLNALVEVERLLLARQAGPGYGAILAPLGEAAGASRVYLFENHINPDGVLFSSQVSEWCAPGISPEIENPALQNVPLHDLFGSLIVPLMRGEAMAATVSDLSPEARAHLEPQGIVSLALLPVIVRGTFWGFIGFDNCNGTRTWQTDEIALLKIAASAVAQAQEREEAEERNRWQATHDLLTGLPNRVQLSAILPEWLRCAAERGEGLAVLFFDLDNFKRINDTLGHTVGDVLLQQVSANIQRVLPPGAFLTRMGGDEFVLVHPSADRAMATLLAAKTLGAVRTPVLLDQYELVTTASIGISLFPDDGASADMLLRHADAALYRAKEAGHNRWQFFTRTMYAEAVDRLELERDLRAASRHLEFVVKYQPQIDLRNDCLVGVEALVRWWHPKRGLLLPGNFIHLAEEMGSAVPLGDFVLYEACQQAARWERQGYAVPIAVNLSPRQFRERDIVSAIASLLTNTGVSPCLLHLELTENALLENAAENIHVLRELRRLGVRLAVDDFGTGYSSLAYLRRFPLDFIKIDRLFIEGIADDIRDQAVVKAVIELAHGLEMKVIAEGVETTTQREILRDLDCDYLQGFLVCEAVAPDRLTPFLNAGTRLTI